MSKTTFYSVSPAKGVPARIGKEPVYKGEGDKAYAEVMLYLIPNGDEENTLPQIVDGHFPKAAFDELKGYGTGDYVRVGFYRFDIKKKKSQKTGHVETYIKFKVNSIKMIRKAPEKKASDVVEKTSAPAKSETTPEVTTVQEQPWT